MANKRRQTLASLKNNREDLLLNLKQFTEMGILPSQAKNEDYYDLLDVMKARPKEERIELIDPIKQLRKSRFANKKGG
ncbi:hypothetical protein [Lactobacillus sp. ESL0225]|uniref:hypothetical protein n=1 Tax=Lactobacillus sp. ESL0225 TaxID=2069351 RepID=UPI000EFC3AB8|nr:hypothetical protein [Lactobacillus sp. ESL0225]RMC47711.1 hypothetical protein F5ESL0225_08095 [Lactobacillus sp. ESL0225]